MKDAYKFLVREDFIVDKQTGKTMIVDHMVNDEFEAITLNGDLKRKYHLRDGGVTWLFPLSFYE